MDSFKNQKSVKESIAPFPVDKNNDSNEDDDSDDSRIHFHPESNNIKAFDKEYKEQPYRRDVETIIEAEEYEEETPFNKQKLVSLRNNLKRQLFISRHGDHTTDSMRGESIGSISDLASIMRENSH